MPARKRKMPALTFDAAFKYPFNRAKGMWNFLLIFLPIIGWFALSGYNIRIVKEFSNGKFKKLPKLNFNKDLKLGFFMFLKSLPFLLVYIAVIFLISLISPFLRILTIPFELIAIPILYVHFFNNETMESLFEFKILKPIFNHLGEYLVILLKSIALSLIFFVMWIVLVGFPAGMFTERIFIADFYRRYIK